ncbi:MAG: histidine kinase [Eubacterium sp.]|jgi:signal transduction histidine kinase|nr:histidine kinase [Eubacterium sp.]
MYQVAEVFFTALEGLIFILGFAAISNRKEFLNNSRLKVLGFIFIYTVYTYWLTLFLPNGFQSIPVLLLTCLILNYAFRGKFLKSSIKTFLILIVISVIEYSLSILIMIVFQISINDLVNNDFLMLVCSIIAKALELTVILIIYRFNMNIVWLNENNVKQSQYKQILIIISTVLFFMVAINIYITGISENHIMYNIFSVTIYILLILSLFFAFREGYKLELLQYANDLKKENIQQLIEFNEMIAKERHEYKNHLNTIYGLCTLNKQDMGDRIKQYINNYANNSLTKSIGINSGNDFVDAIINVKYNNALGKGIEISVAFEEPLTAASIDEDAAVTVISNILENAIESLANNDKENRFVKVKAFTRDNKYMLSISNNGPKIPEPDMKKIFNAGYSTKDNASKTRGFGLSIVRNELVRCSGEVSINSSEELTEFLFTFWNVQQKAVV